MSFISTLLDATFTGVMVALSVTSTFSIHAKSVLLRLTDSLRDVAKASGLDSDDAEMMNCPAALEPTTSTYTPVDVKMSLNFSVPS